LHRAIPFGACGVLNLATDVTEQRRMEDELRNYAKVAAHDLREPIMAAGYFIQLLDRRLSNGRNAENEELLARVRQTHARARSLVDGILEYARSGTGLAADAVDTGALVADVACTRFRRSARCSSTRAVGRLWGRLHAPRQPSHLVGECPGDALDDCDEKCGWFKSGALTRSLKRNPLASRRRFRSRR
jgi:signal transduction histidine kinase